MPYFRTNAAGSRAKRGAHFQNIKRSAAAKDVIICKVCATTILHACNLRAGWYSLYYAKKELKLYLDPYCLFS